MTGVKNNDLYHRMIEEVQDYAILLLDKQGNVVNWNKGAEKIKGYSESEIVGKNFRIFYGENDRENKLPEQLIAEATSRGKATHEGWRFRKNGERFWGSIVITAIHDDHTEVIGFTKVTRDLTERKLAEDSVKAKAQELEFRNRELEQFAYVASHDLQEPLRKIQVFVGILEKSVKEESLLKFTEKISSSAKRMSALIKDVLQYSKLAQHDELFINVDLNVVLKDVLEDLELLLEEKQMRVENNTLPVISGVAIQLSQLFFNLISNAIKFSNDNSVMEIRSEPVPAEEVSNYPEINQTRQYIRLSFIDHGVGFDTQYTDEVFKLFKRLQDREAGTGIGLALCKKIVENHGGNISVSSELNKGTTFYIVLPMK